MNRPINKGVSSALPRVVSRRSAILKIVEEKTLGTRLGTLHVHIQSDSKVSKVLESKLSNETNATGNYCSKIRLLAQTKPRSGTTRKCFKFSDHAIFFSESNEISLNFEMLLKLKVS